MADVFLSYKREERAEVERLATALRGLGLDVWFDASLSAGEAFSDEIDREVRAARVVLVCWSPQAATSQWVKAEAQIGFTKQTLISTYVAGPDGFDPPVPFNSIHMEDMRAWAQRPSARDPAWLSVLRRLGGLAGRADIAEWGALGASATIAQIEAWLDAHAATSPLVIDAESFLRERSAVQREREAEETAARERVERLRVEKAAAETTAREAQERAEAEKRAREAEARAAKAERLSAKAITAKHWIRAAKLTGGVVLFFAIAFAGLVAWSWTESQWPVWYPSVTLTDVGEGTEFGEFRATRRIHGDDSVYSAEFSPVDDRIVMDFGYGTASTIVSQNSEVRVAGASATFHPNGSQVLTITSEGELRLWDAATGSHVRQFAGNFHKARFSSDGSHLLTISSETDSRRTAQLISIADGQVISSFLGHTESINDVRFSTDGTRVVTASSDTTARIWDAATGAELIVLRGHTRGLTSAAFSPDGRRVVTTTGSAWVWDAATGRFLFSLRAPGGIWHYSAEYSPDGRWILTANPRRVTLWDASSGEQLARFAGHQYPNGARFSREGSRILTFGRNGAVLWSRN